MKRTLVFLNDRAANDANLLAAIEDQEVSSCILCEPGHACREAAKCNGADFDRLIAAGGDGTLNEVVNGVMSIQKDQRPAVAVIPYGTANDFSRIMQVPTDAVAALECILEARPTAIDVGKFNDEYFVNVVTGGIGAQITSETPKELKDLVGGLAYTLVGVSRAFESTAVPVPVYIKGDNFEWQGGIAIVNIGNSRFAGGGYQVAPKAIINDGALDLRILPYQPSERLGPYLLDYLSQQIEQPEGIYFRRLRELTIQCEEIMHFNLDGEPRQTKEASIRVEKEALPFLLPNLKALEILS